MLKSVKEFYHDHEEEVIRAGVTIVVMTACCTIAYKMGMKDANVDAARKIFSDFGNTIWKTAIEYVEANGIEAAKTCLVDPAISIG